MKKEIVPFQFRLKKISRKHQELVDGLLEFLPAKGVRETFHISIRKALHQYFPDIRYYVEAISPKNFHDLEKDLHYPCCVALLGMEPLSERAFVQIDPLIAHLAIEKLLGGRKDLDVELRELTETEQGIIEFLILKLLAAIDQLCGEKAKLHFRLEGLVMEPGKVHKLQGEKNEMVCVKVHLNLLQRSGFLNLYLPHPWIAEGFLKGLPGEISPSGQAERKEGLAQYGNFPLDLVGTVGEATVSYADTKNLEEGDVILLDRADLKKREKHWAGSVRLGLKESRSPGLKAEWKGFKTGGKVILSK